MQQRHRFLSKRWWRSRAPPPCALSARGEPVRLIEMGAGSGQGAYGRRETEFHAATDAVSVGAEEILGERGALEPTIDLGGNGQLGKLDHARGHGMNGGGVSVAHRQISISLLQERLISPAVFELLLRRGATTPEQRRQVIGEACRTGQLGAGDCPQQRQRRY